MKDHVQAGCTGKRSFKTKKQAEAAAKRMRRKYEAKLAEYHCAICRQWHVGEE